MITIQVLTSQNWKMYKTIRLEALKSDPQAFGSSYEKESAFSDEKWQERLGDPTVCVLVAKENEIPVGMIGYHLKNNGENAHLWGMFVASTYRGKGVGKQLLQKIIEMTKEKQSVRDISLDVNPDQVSAVKLYTSLGFQENGTREYLMGDGAEHILTTMVMKIA